jgi:hypothetical protein
MVDTGRKPEANRDGISRRTVLKAVSMAGLAGATVTGVASAAGSTITFRAAPDATFEFQLIVSGDVKTDGGTVNGVLAENDLQVAGNVVQGRVSDGGEKNFEFTGEISVLQLGGRGKVFLNGNKIRDTTGGGDAAADDGKRFPKEVIIDSPGDDTLRDYVFFVRGANARLKKLEPNEDSGPAVDDVRRLDNGDIRVDGTVGSGDDRFAFNGTFEKGNPFPPQVRARIRER